MEVHVLDRIRYEDILPLIRYSWPSQWGLASESEMIATMYRSDDYPNDTHILLIEEKTMIGWCRYTTWPKNVPNCNSVHLMDIVVTPGAQGKGFGSMLMETMIERCKAQKISSILSRTYKDNQKSQSLHEKAGFIVDFTTDDSIVWKREV